MISTDPFSLLTDLPVSLHVPQPGTSISQRLLTDPADGYLVTDGAGTIQEVNRSAAELLQTSSASLRGRPMLRYLTQDSRKLFLSFLRRLHTSSARVESWSVSLQPQRGPSVHATLSVLASRDVTGRFLTLHCQLSNVTPCQRRESPLEHCVSQHADLDKTNDLTLCTHDLDGILLFVNRTVAAALGYQTQQMVGHSLAEFLVHAQPQHGVGIAADREALFAAHVHVLL